MGNNWETQFIISELLAELKLVEVDESEPVVDPVYDCEGTVVYSFG